MDFNRHQPQWNRPNPQPPAPREPNKILVWLQNFARKNTRSLVIFLILLIVGLVLLNESFFIVNEAEQAVVSRFGVIKSIILDNKNTFHERFQDRLAGEITVTGEVAVKQAAACI